MAKKFSVLRAKMPKASHARANRRTREMLKQMPLHELRAKPLIDGAGEKSSSKRRSHKAVR